MRDPNRIPVYLELLGRAWKAHPEMRLGQLIDNGYITATVGERISPDLFYIEDLELIEGVMKNTEAPTSSDAAKGAR